MKRLIVPALAAVSFACVIDNRVGRDAAHVYVQTDDDAGTSTTGDGGDDTADAGPLTNSISGSISGATLNIAEATAFDSTSLSEGVQGDLWVVLSNTSDMCYRLTNGAAAAQSNAISFYLIQTDGFGQPTAATPGTYLMSTSSSPGPNQMAAYISFSENDAQCQATVVAPTDGTVILHANGVASSGVTDGTFDFNFSGSHVTGSFSAQPCSGAVRTVTFCD